MSFITRWNDDRGFGQLDNGWALHDRVGFQLRPIVDGRGAECLKTAPVNFAAVDGAGRFDGCPFLKRWPANAAAGPHAEKADFNSGGGEG